MVNGRRRGTVAVVDKARLSEVDRALGHCPKSSDKETPKNAA
jgi:hypothetical protein